MFLRMAVGFAWNRVSLPHDGWCRPREPRELIRRATEGFRLVLILAYIDPGAGSLVIQALIAAALSVPFIFRRAIASAVQRVRPRHDERASVNDAPFTDVGD